MNILIHEQDTPTSVVRDALQAAITAGNGNVHCKLSDGGVVKITGATIGAYDVSPGGKRRWFLAGSNGNMVYVEDVDWIEGYEGSCSTSE